MLLIKLKTDNGIYFKGSYRQAKIKIYCSFPVTTLIRHPSGIEVKSFDYQESGNRPV